ncbi:MAG: DUF2723 domain-containing protein [Chloroflexi bacterium]|jgi:hypothetical protein|nr:DUF2723 domain-containing protein [Chloroflexota bacterium]MBT4074845.1 DUF2723 domain-containing protein [Chloroflexota bacterium]MBT4514477.1 DUF2723 domain-containing protein [Chloroflexota bacterium]
MKSKLMPKSGVWAERVHRHRVGLGAIAVGAVSFLLYVLTLAPGLTWSNSAADGGDLLTAAFRWGIPHPTGYPTYLLSLRSFSTVMPFGGVAFHGNLFSAITAAVAMGMLFLVTVRVLRRLHLPTPIDDRHALVVAAVSTISMAASRMLWSQATVTEVYALNAMFVSAILLAAFGLRDRQEGLRADAGGKGPGWRYGLAIGLLSGIALGNHLTIAALIAPMLVWGLLGGGIRSLAATHIIPMVLGGLVGVSVYAYAPLASAQSPVLNWGHPDTAEGFWWMVSGSIYQGFTFDVRGEELFRRAVTSTDHLFAQFAFIGVLLGLAGLGLMWDRMRSLLIAHLVTVVAVVVYAITYRTIDSFLYLIPVFMLFSIWMAVGMARMLSHVDEVREAIRPLRTVKRPVVVGISVVIVLAVVPGFSIATNWGSLDLSDDREASNYAESAFETMEPGSIVITRTDQTVFSLWFQAYVADTEHSVMAVSAPHIVFDWYWDDLVQQYPDRMPDNRPEGLLLRVLSIIDHNLGINQIYEANAPAEAFPEFQLVEDGPLKRFVPG